MPKTGILTEVGWRCYMWQTGSVPSSEGMVIIALLNCKSASLRGVQPSYTVIIPFRLASYYLVWDSGFFTPSSTPLQSPRLQSVFGFNDYAEKKHYCCKSSVYLWNLIPNVCLTSIDGTKIKPCKIPLHKCPKANQLPLSTIFYS